MDVNPPFVFLHISFKLPIHQEFIYGYRGSKDVLYCRVLCSFGNRKLVGVVTEISPDIDENIEIKDILEVIDDEALLDEKTLQLAKWIAFYSISSLGEAISLFLPFSVLKPKKIKEKKDIPLATIALNKDQEEVFQKVIHSDHKMALLHGITGSGKTSVYLKLIQYYLSKEKQIILLVSEIGLTPQIYHYISKYLPQNKVAIIHSQIGTQKRINLLSAFKKGEVQVLIGTRLALLSTPHKLGLVIIDEEHENTFKNSSSPRYHSRQIAQMISKYRDSYLLLGSATPSIETYYQVKEKNIELLELKKRYYGSELPETKIVKNFFDPEDIFEKGIKQRLKEIIESGQKAIIFLNRRGYSNSISCLECQKMMKCSNCDIPYSYHQKQNRWVCHYCNERINYTEECLYCQSSHIYMLGAGVERVENQLKKYLKDVVIARVDSDTTQTPRQVEREIEKFKNGDAQILLGTQIISKGHDFEDVKEVFILFPENTLMLLDFRASEKTYGQIAQVSGRVGRRDKKGIAYIQTYMVDHYAITLGANQNYLDFYEQEISRRKIFEYPPYTRLFRIVFRSEDEAAIRLDTLESKKFFTQNLNQEIEILGPTTCVLSKVKKNYRYQILFKIKNNVYSFIKTVHDYKKRRKYSKVYREYDMDPMDIL